MAVAFVFDLVFESSVFERLVDFCGTIGTIGPDLFASIVRIKQAVEHLAVVHRGVGDIIGSNELVLAVSVDVVLVTVMVVALHLHPAGVGVFLLKFVGLLFPAFGNLALFDAGVLFASVALHGDGHDAGVNELSLAGDEAFVVEIPVELAKQLVNGSFIRQRVAKQP